MDGNNQGLQWRVALKSKLIETLHCITVYCSLVFLLFRLKHEHVDAFW